MNQRYSESDPRFYIAALMKNWMFLAAFTALTVLFTVIAMFMRSDQFESTALLTIPRERLQVDVSSESLLIDGTPSTATAASDFVTFVQSDGVILALQQRLSESGTVIGISDLGHNISSRTVSRSEIVELSATADTPEMAATIATLWAEVAIEQAGSFYNGMPSDSIDAYDLKLAEGRADVTRLNQELVAFESENRYSIVKAQLAAANSQLTSQLNRIAKIERIVQDAKNLTAQLDGMSEASVATELRLLQLQLDSSAASGASALQLSDLTTLDVRPVSEQKAQLALITDSLLAEAILINRALPETEATILSLQSEFAGLETQQSTIQSNLTAAEAYVADLAEAVNGIRVATSDGGAAELKVLSNAIPNAEPVNSSALTNVVLAAVVGLLLSAGLVMLNVWWHGGDGELPAMAATQRDAVGHAGIESSFGLPTQVSTD